MTSSDESDFESVLFPSGAVFVEGARQSILFGQYRLFVDSSEKLVARRQTVNTFFLSINALLLSAAGFIVKDVPQEGAAFVGVLALGLAGILSCITWRNVLRSYRQLNAGKFVVIHALEQHLPAALFNAEWHALGEGRDKKKYTPFTTSEALIPIVFAVLYSIAMLGSVIQRFVA